MLIRKILLPTILLLAPSLAGAAERSLFDTHNRFLDKSIDTKSAKIVPSTTLIDSFEEAPAPDTWQFKNVDQSLDDAHATDGKKSLKLAFKDSSSLVGYRKGLDGWGGGNDGQKPEDLSSWSAQIIFNDEFRLDVFNPQEKEITLTVKFGKPFTFKLVHGKNQIAIKTKDAVDFAYRSTSILQHTDFSVDQPATLYFDNLHWVGPGVGENLLKFGKLFDCGAGNPNYLRPYFNLLSDMTAYDKQKGFGWENPRRGNDRHHSISSSSGRQPTDQLIRDSIRDISYPLLVDLPDGKYRVQWVEGESFPYFNDNFPMDYDLAIKANGVTTPIRTGAKTFADRLRYIYGREKVDYLPNQDRWSAFLGDWFCPMECDVTVTGGQLKLEFATNPPNRANAAFIIIYPVEKAALIEPELALFWQDIRDRYNTLSFQQATPRMARQMNLPGLHEEMLDPADAHKRHAELARLPAAKNGLLVFNRPAADDVFPDTVPQQTELAHVLATSGIPGEISSLALNLHAMKDIHKLTVTLADFISDDGKKIPPTAATLRFVRYSYRMTGQQTHGDWKYLVMPWFLVQRDSIEMPNAMSTRWWINIDLPSDTAPGAYTGAATIQSPDIAPITVKLTLTVLPIKLDPVPPNIDFATVWHSRGEHAIEPDVWSYFTTTNAPDADANRIKKELAEKRAQRISAEFALMRRYGINTVYHNPNDPPGKGDLEGIRLLPFSDASKRTFLQYLNSMNEKALAESKDPALTSLMGGNIESISAVQEEPNIYRFCTGALLWRMRAGGTFLKVWRDPFGDPYHPFDYHCGEFGDLAAPASTNWPTMNSTVLLEGIREGILDYRYLITLEHLLKESPNHPAAPAAKKLLQELTEKIQPDARHYFVEVGVRGGWDHTWRQKDTAWKAADYSLTRDRLAALIAEFQKP
jgi:hypothetical protein